MSKFMPPKPNPTEGYLSDPKISYIEFKKWYDTHIKPLFENAIQVHLHKGAYDKYYISETSHPNETHTGLLINIQKIEPESAEDILRELVKAMNDTCIIEYKGTPPNTLGINSAFAKARKFLEKIKGDGE